MVKKAKNEIHLGFDPIASDHFWIIPAKGSDFKCARCGTVSNDPPQLPTPPDWMPDRYEPLTAEERAQCPKKK